MSTVSPNVRLIPPLPTSPIKQNILQPSLAFSLNPTNKKSSQPITNVNVALLKPVQVLTASADSTESNKSKTKGRKRKQKNVSNTKNKNEVTTNNQIPFVKHHHSVKKPQTPSVSRRNARERNRVKQVNNGFSTLRNHIPHLKNKTSKVDTLRAAVDYIQTLRGLLGEDISGDEAFTGPILITDAQEERRTPKNFHRILDDSIASSGSPPPRSSSAQSGDMNPLIYQLPPPTSLMGDFIHNSSEIGSHSPDVGDVDEEDEGIEANSSSPYINSKENDAFWWQRELT